MENNPARLSSFPTVFGPCICTLTYLLGRRAARPVKARGAADVGARARGATGRGGRAQEPRGRGRRAHDTGAGARRFKLRFLCDSGSGLLRLPHQACQNWVTSSFASIAFTCSSGLLQFFFVMNIICRSTSG
jgi:hypothetical protein